MPHDSPIAGITLPDGGDTADGPTALAAMVADFEQKLILPMTHSARLAIDTGDLDGPLAVMETDTGELWFWYDGDLGWAPPWNTSWGLMDEARGTFDNISTTTVTLLSVTFTAVVGRNYEITAKCGAHGAVGGSAFYAHTTLTNGANSVLDNSYVGMFDDVFSIEHLTNAVVVSPGAGSYTAKLRGDENVSGRAWDMHDGQLIVKDIGPSGPIT